MVIKMPFYIHRADSPSFSVGLCETTLSLAAAECTKAWVSLKEVMSQGFCSVLVKLFHILDLCSNMKLCGTGLYSSN